MLAIARARGGMGRLIILLVMVLSGLAAPSPVVAREVVPVTGDEGEKPVPLAEALRRFAKESGYDVVFPEGLVRGRHAAPVVNAHNAFDRLTQMLAGSGLAPRFTRRDAFLLEPVTPPSAPDMALDSIEVLVSPVGDEERREYRWYGEKLLNASLSVLRRSRELGFRTYDFTLYVWLSREGRIVELDGYGAEEHEDSVAIAKTMLRGLLIDTIPPLNMPQPVGLRIVAQ